MPGAGDPIVLDRLVTPGGELVLRRAGGVYEIISNGTFLMDTSDGRSERLLARAVLDRHGRARSALVGGLGVGFSLVEALRDPDLDSVVVVEREPAVVGWHRTHLASVSAGALDDPRVEVVVGDVQDVLHDAAAGFDVICLDVDNGPDWTVTPANASLYDDAGTDLLAARLRPGGVLGVWAAQPSPSYLTVLRRHLDDVRVLEVPVRRGPPDVVLLGSRR
jgi:spermidine synthase